MPVNPFDTRFQEALSEIMSISDQISSAAALAYRASFQSASRPVQAQVQDFRSQIENIRSMSKTILDAITFHPDSIDERILDWAFSGEQRLCLDKLKEMLGSFKADCQDRPTMPLTRTLRSATDRRPVADGLSAAIALFSKHKNLFHFLLARDFWDREPLPQPPEPPQIDPTPIIEETQERRESTIPTRNNAQPVSRRGTHEPPSNASQSVVAKRKKDTSYQTLGEVQRWLDALDCTEKHDATHKLRQKGTCTWLPRTAAYKSWRDGGCKFLWLNGKAGSGKSVLASSTIEHLKTTLRYKEALVFFYCDFRRERSTRPAEVMRSILSQLLRHICDLLVDPGELPKKLLQEKSEGVPLLDDLQKLCDFISLAGRCFVFEPIVVIDALDECMDVESLMDALLKLNADDIRLLVTSRPEEKIKRCFSRRPSLSLQNLSTELAEDIALHVRRELDSRQQLRSADRKVKTDISMKLNRKADGRFRWVQCQLDALDRCTAESELNAALENLPEGLEETYEKILEAIDERNSEGDLVRRALAWLIVAPEPLCLAQIVDGLSLYVPQQKDSNRTRSLLHGLSSLVTYFETTDIVTLSHYSVKEYLTSHTTLPIYHIVPREAHAEVAKMCMRRISVFLKGDSTRTDLLPLKSSPMLPYVLSSGFIHLAHVDPGSEDVLEALRSLGLDVRYLPSHWDCLCELREADFGWPYPPWLSARHNFEIYILIAYASSELLRTFFSRRRFDSRLGTNPLVYAADLRKTEHAKILLEFDIADVNKRCLAFDDSYSASPLEVAVDRGNVVLVGELLQKGCLVASELLATTVCLPWCSTTVLVKLIQTDEFIKWAREIGDEKLYRGVFNSARPDAGDSKKTDEDHVALTRRLQEVGLNFSPDTPFGTELIEQAVRAAHTSMLELLLPQDEPPPSRFLLAAATGDTPETVSVVRFLLRKGVDINAVSDGRKDTALHLAALCAWEPRSLELAELLVAAGCDPHQRNSRGETPFTIAVERGYVPVIDTLLSCVSTFPSDIIHFALQRRPRNVKMIRRLVHGGANVHAVTPSGDNVLHLAIIGHQEYTSGEEEDEEENPGVHRADREANCLALVKSFLQAGCDSTAHDSDGKTVMEAAVKRRYPSVVEHLLSCGVQVPPNILPIALRQRLTIQMVQLLLREGADVHSTTSNGDTLLHLSIAEYSEQTCLELMKTFIDAGCDPTARNLKGQTVLGAAVEHGFTLVVEYLLSCNVPVPPNILPNALRHRLHVQTVQVLIHNGADIQSTTCNGDTVLHFAIAAYPEPTCLDLMKHFVDAGCDPTARNNWGKTILDTAVCCGYMSVVDYLLARKVPVPGHVLEVALRRRCRPEMIELLLRKETIDISKAPTSDWDDLQELVNGSYTGQESQRVIEILEVARKGEDHSPKS